MKCFGAQNPKTGLSILFKFLVFTLILFVFEIVRSQNCNIFVVLPVVLLTFFNVPFGPCVNSYQCNISTLTIYQKIIRNARFRKCNSKCESNKKYFDKNAFTVPVVLAIF